MMAQYSRQFNLDTEAMEDRSLSPTCEVLSDQARTVFVTPSLTYRVRNCVNIILRLLGYKICFKLNLRSNSFMSQQLIFVGL